MNDFLTKIILEKEQKFKSTNREIKLFQNFLDDVSNELIEKNIKNYAMSHYQEDKNHHKRSSNYGEYNQWEYLNQQDIQPTNNHNRRGPFSFGSTSQQHSVGWNPMGITIPRQSNPYYANPCSQMMPAHAHSEYRYNQWSNPNNKNIPNIHNAHSQNTVLSQAKMDLKSHADITNTVQNLGLPVGAASDYSKFRPNSRDLMHRVPSNLTEKLVRSGLSSDHFSSSVSSSVRNCSSVKTSSSNHHKSIINNPLSDLQMLVTNQVNENFSQKTENFQQESVDLSAHSENSKSKESSEDKSLNGSNEFRSLVSVIQIQNKQSESDSKETEEPVELTSKNVRDGLGNASVNIESKTENLVESEVKKSEEKTKISVIVSKDGEPLVTLNNNEKDIPDKSQKDGNKSIENNIEINEKDKFTADDSSDNSKSGNLQVPTHKTIETVNTADSKSENTNEPLENNAVTGSCKRKADEEDSGENKKIILEVNCSEEKICENDCIKSTSLPTVTSTSVEKKVLVNERKKKRPKKKPLKKSKLGRLSSGQSSGSERSLFCKKLKNLGVKEDTKKKVKKTLCDVIERRGPFLHVEGFRDSPTNVILINYPKGDDEDEKDKNSFKKLSLNSGRTKHHNELDYRGRSRNGLYSSTLSARYDAHTTDHTWICVFCKKGPHYNTMGDLFGPYIISKDENITLGDFSGDEKDISDAQKRGGRNKKSIRSNNMVEHFQKMSRKLRRTQSSDSCLTGMTVISDDQLDQLRYEVWVHEQCAVWSPNVFLIGSRIIGMQEAIWCSIKTMCSKCGIFGANLGCVYRNCPNRSHYPCAKESGWSLEQETFISTCQIHKPRS